MNFLDALKSSNTKILVYTRGLPDQSPPDIIERWNKLLLKVKDLKGQAELFIMPKRQDACFRDSDDSGPFQNKVRQMLRT